MFWPFSTACPPTRHRAAARPPAHQRRRRKPRPGCTVSARNDHWTSGAASIVQDRSEHGVHAVSGAPTRQRRDHQAVMPAGADCRAAKAHSALSATRGPQTENTAFPGPCAPTERHSPPGVTKRVTPARPMPLSRSLDRPGHAARRVPSFSALLASSAIPLRDDTPYFCASFLMSAVVLFGVPFLRPPRRSPGTEPLPAIATHRYFSNHPPLRL